MGNCCFSSFDSNQIATAKLILHDGVLQEFSYAVKVSFLLQKYPTYFICNSNDMDFDDVVTAIDEDEVLETGELYFAIPLSKLKLKLQADEMAALAVKASLALTKSGGDKCRFRRKRDVLFSGEERGKSYRRVVMEVGGDVDMSRRGKSGGRGRNLTAELSSIPE
ncbi:hypothetical protein TanjilG_14268 [Lupinus angustifolius]|uniref:Uncharacterized protein n=1 Tax=Lupinus angustifolius TaxID=3871 RepID=A0A1J7I4Q1_LUPAN|nr:PREDICTED: uncharacterized protein LOC109350835 [Lupinus angustifolius]OIW09745.1 hypothetical protein TanjilG_14268 [Lupinus angustifolius]